MWLPGLWKWIHWRVSRAAKRGDLGRAKAIADRYLRLRPRDPMAWYVAAGPRGGDWKEMERLAREGLRRDSRSPLLRDMLALALGEQKRWDESAAIWTSLKDEFPWWYAPYVGLALMADDRDDPDLCRELIREAIHRDVDGSSIPLIEFAIELLELEDLKGELRAHAANVRRPGIVGIWRSVVARGRKKGS